MPRKKRKSSEIEAAKKRILKHAVMLMNQVGFEGFTMRGLAQMLGVTAPTIYSYYQNKDELYLVILTEGFQMMYNKQKRACQAHTDPFAKLRALVTAYVDFGIQHTNFYNLMYTWHVPKYNDYVGTALEEAAYNELVTSQKSTNLALETVKECFGNDPPLPDDDARFYLVYFWNQLHGYVASVNNEGIVYVVENPLSIKDRVLDLTAEIFRSEVAKYREQHNKRLSADADEPGLQGRRL